MSQLDWLQCDTVTFLSLFPTADQNKYYPWRSGTLKTTGIPYICQVALIQNNTVNNYTLKMTRDKQTTNTEYLKPPITKLIWDHLFYYIPWACPTTFKFYKTTSISSVPNWLIPYATLPSTSNNISIDITHGQYLWVIADYFSPGDERA